MQGAEVVVCRGARRWSNGCFACCAAACRAYTWRGPITASMHASVVRHAYSTSHADMPTSCCTPQGQLSCIGNLPVFPVALYQAVDVLKDLLHTTSRPL